MRGRFAIATPTPPSTSADPAVNPNAAGPPAPGTTAAKPSKPPALPPLPPPKTKNTSTGAAFNAFINAHPTMRPYADLIWKYAKAYGVDQVVMAGLYWRESFAAAKAQGKDPATIESPTHQGVGIGQINPVHVGEKTPWGHTITQSDLTNPKFNIQWSSWFFSQQIAKYGDANTAYNKGYNPGYTGPDLTSLLPKGYVPRSGLSPTDKAAISVETKAATTAAAAQTFDKWAVITDKGTIKFVSIADASKPPKNVLKYAGAPLTQSSFNQVWDQTYKDTFFAYTGRNATGNQIRSILAQAPSIYTLSNRLATDPKSGFDKSPVWKQHAPGLVEYARTILGENWKPSGDIIRRAIAQNWDQATFTAHLRNLPAYERGPEFKTNLAQNTAAFEAVYGKASADPSLQQSLKAKTLAGWTPQELQAWLRDQPAYQHSSEYQAKQTAFLGQLGLITGQGATLSGQQVDQMLDANPFPNTSPGAAPNRPDNRPGPRGANPGGTSTASTLPRAGLRPQTKTPSSGR